MSISTKYTSNRNTYSVHKMPSTSIHCEEYYEYPLSKPLLLSIWIAWPAMRKHWPKTTFYQLLSFFVIVLAFFWILLLLYGNAVQASPPSFAFPSFLSLAGPSDRATYMLCNLVFESQILADLAKRWKLLTILNRNLAWNGKRVREGLIKKIKATQVNKATSPIGLCSQTLCRQDLSSVRLYIGRQRAESENTPR